MTTRRDALKFAGLAIGAALTLPKFRSRRPRESVSVEAA